MEGIGVRPVKEAAVGIDEEEYVSQSKLYKEFTSIATIDKAWTFNSPNGRGSHTMFTITQPNLLANKKKKHMLSSVISEDSDGGLDVQWSPFPVEVTGASLMVPSPSGSKLLVVRNPENDSPTLFEIWGPSQVEKEIRVPQSVHGSVYADGWFEGISWSSDESLIAYVAEEPAQPKPTFNDTGYKKDASSTDKDCSSWKGQGDWEEEWGEAYVGKRQPALFVININSGDVRAVEGIGRSLSVGQVVWAPATKGLQQYLVFVGWPSDTRKFGMIYCFNRPCALYAVKAPLFGSDVKDNAIKDVSVIKLSKATNSAFLPRFTPDGKFLVFLSAKSCVDSGAHSATQSLHKIEWNSEGEPTPAKIIDVVPVVMCPEDGCFPGIYCFSVLSKPWLSDGYTMILSSIWGSTEVIISVNVLSGKVSRVTPGDSNHSWSLLTLNDNKILAVCSSLVDVPQIKYGSVTKGESQDAIWRWLDVSSPTSESKEKVKSLLSSLQIDILKIPVKNVSENLTKGASKPIEAIFVSSRSKQDACDPMIVILHGGPHGVTLTSFSKTSGFLASIGYSLLIVNYRGSIGFGEEALQSLPGKIGSQDVTDVLTAVDHAIDTGLANPSKISVLGGSHGGFLTTHLIGQAPDRFAAAAARNPVCNLALMVGTSDIPDWCFVETFGPEGISTYTEAPSPQLLASFHEKSPISHLPKVKTPTLFLLGAKDLRVPVSNGLQFARALKEKGVPVKVIVFPEDIHPISRMIPGPDGIELDVWNDGIFKEDPLRYEDGVILNAYVARLPLKDLIEHVKRYTACAHVFGLYYKMPHSELDKGLVKLDCDWECNRMYDLARLFGKIEVYVDHTNLDFSKYLAINDPDTPTSKYRAEKKKRYCNEFSEDELVNWAEQEVEMEVGIGNNFKGKASVVDKGKASGVDKGKASVGDAGVSDPDVSELLVATTNASASDSDDSDYVDTGMIQESDSDDSAFSDKSFDYLSAGEEELIQHRTRKANRVKTKGTSVPDMAANPSNTRPRGGERSEVFVEHDEFLDELLKKINDVDSDGNLQDPFLGVQATQDRYPTHDESTHWRMQAPKVGLKFASVDKLKEALTNYALANGYSIWYERCASDMIIARCGQRPPGKLKDPEKGKQRKQFKYPSEIPEDVPKCSFRLYARWMTSERTFQVISLKSEHTCVRNFQYGSLVDYKWIGKKFGEKIRKNPDIKLVDIADLVMKKYKCTVSLNQCRAAKKWALTEFEKTIEEHYALLRSYGKELLDSNPGSTVKLGVTHNEEGGTVFDRFYVCLGGLKEGFKRGCRRVVALDGCFLKRPNQGEILTAIGRDGNNQIYPIAWAVVSVENKDTWCWFLELIVDDLEMPNGAGLTLMSDQHKGLIEAVKQVMPQAEHRQCARHIYENFRKQFSGEEFRLLFWGASKATYPQWFNKVMDKIKAANPNAHKYLMDKDPKTWSRAFFELDRGCEAVENGFSECFNSVLVSVRDKPILTMLEAIRVIVLERMNTMRQISAKWTGDICPSIKKRVDLLKDDIRFWHVIPVGGNNFEVRNGSYSFKVKVDERTCSCRMWQLSGLPCVHGTAAILRINRLPEAYVPNWFRKELYYATYHNYLSPVGGIDFWPDQSQYSKVLPPKFKKMPGRPRKKRIRAKGEGGSSTRVSKVGVSMTCQNCFKVGHNKKGCKEATVEKPVKPKGKAGRPSKVQVRENVETASDNVPPASDNVPPPSATNNVSLGSGSGRGSGGGDLVFQLRAKKHVGRGLSGESVAVDVRGSDIPGMHTQSQQSAFTRVGGVQFATTGARRSLRPHQPTSKGFAYWFGEEKAGQSSQPSQATQGSQTSQPSQAMQDIPTQASQVFQASQPNQEVQPNEQRPFVIPRRVPSQRILQKKLTKKVDGEGSSQEHAMVLD